MQAPKYHTAVYTAETPDFAQYVQCLAGYNTAVAAVAAAGVQHHMSLLLVQLLPPLDSHATMSLTTSG